MTYRTKLMTLLVGLVVLTNGLLEYRRCEELLQREFHRKARSIVSTAAALLDPELIGAIRNSGDLKKPEYTKLRTQLQSIPDVNRQVNLATRLESATKELGLGIAVSEQTYACRTPVVPMEASRNDRDSRASRARARI